jgi:hypothetical protein
MWSTVTIVRIANGWIVHEFRKEGGFSERFACMTVLELRERLHQLLLDLEV